MKNRRVGTLTLGIFLISFGIVFLISIFFKNFDVITVLKFSPIFLIILGIEVLIGAFTSGEAKLKYDGVSIFISLVIIFICLFAGAVPFTYNHILKNPANEYKYAAQLKDQVKQSISGNFKNYNIKSSVQLYENTDSGTYKYDKNKMNSDVYIDVDDNLTTSEAAEKIMNFKDSLREKNIEMSFIEITIDDVEIHISQSYDDFLKITTAEIN